MDILQPLPLEKWTLLRDTLRRDWPIYAYYYLWVNNAMKWREKDPKLQLEIFCPKGKHESGVFVGIASYSIYQVFIFTFNESRNLLEKVLKETNVINWKNNVTFVAVHQYFKKILLDFIAISGKTKGLEYKSEDVTYFYFKSKLECAKMSVSIPQECELKYLDESHVQLIHSVWPHRNIEKPEISMKFLSTIIRLNKGIGLFLKENGALVSWVLNFDLGGLGILQTLNEYKRKGYGKAVIQALAKELAEENLDSIATIIENNIASQKLFESLGYKRHSTATWIVVRPITELR